MKHIVHGILALMITATGMQALANQDGLFVIFDFNEDADVSGWEVEDDVVMGGRSSGRFIMNEDGHGVFSGDVSLENDGGFSSIQRYMSPVDVSGYDTIVLRVRGDGKSYQFRVESSPRVRHSYVYTFPTSGEWETIEIPFNAMYPSWRGDRLDLPNFPGETMSQLRFLIGNNRAESFRLEIDYIALK